MGKVQTDQHDPKGRRGGIAAAVLAMIGGLATFAYAENARSNDAFIPFDETIGYTTMLETGSARPAGPSLVSTTPIRVAGPVLAMVEAFDDTIVGVATPRQRQQTNHENANAYQIDDIRVGQHPGWTRIVIDVVGPVVRDASGRFVGPDLSVRPTIYPPRLILDLGNFDLTPAFAERMTDLNGRGLVKAARLRLGKRSQSGGDGARLELALNDRARVERQFFIGPTKGRLARMVIDVVRSTEAGPPRLSMTARPVDAIDDGRRAIRLLPLRPPLMGPGESRELSGSADNKRAETYVSEGSRQREVPSLGVPFDPFGNPSQDPISPQQAPATLPAAPFVSGTGRQGLTIAWDLEVQAEGRLFTEDAVDASLARGLGSFAIEPRVELEWGGGNQSFAVTGFGRVDSNDGARTTVDLREARWMGVFGPLEARIGVDKVFWGVIESVHLIDIINQDAALEDIDAEDKLGQPMGQLSLFTDYGQFSFFALPFFRERQFPGEEGRPRFPLLVDTSQPLFESSAEEWSFDWAVRWSKSVGPLDVGLAHFSGTARDPVFVPGTTEAGAPVLLPAYEQINQSSFDVQGTFGAALLKAEGFYQINRDGGAFSDDFFAFGAGIEYTFYNVAGAFDVGLLSEYLYDERGETIISPFENDLFYGVRVGFTDAASTQLLAGAITDLDGDGTAINVEGSRRVGENWLLTLDARLFVDQSATSGLAPFADDDFIQFRITRFF
ncbi:MAG: hypothetical protein AAGF15_04125 [Pseudomonadota bacterium]